MRFCDATEEMPLPDLRSRRTVLPMGAMVCRRLEKNMVAIAVTAKRDRVVPNDAQQLTAYENYAALERCR